MHGFYESNKSHFADEKVYLQSNDFLPFEVAYRFLLAVDPTIKRDRKLSLVSDDTSSVNCTEGNQPEKTYLIIHRLLSDKKGIVEEGIKQEKCESVVPIDKFLEAMHYDAKVVRKDNVTHIFWFQRIGSQPSIYIKLAFSLRILCPTLFEDGKPVFCDEFKRVMSFVDKDDYNGAWEVIDPYFVALRREQWLKDIKQMFVNSYGSQIEALKNDIERYYSAIRNLNEQISQQYKCIENTEIKIRGMLASNSTEKNYDEFIGYLKDIGGEIAEYNNGKMKLRFFGLIDDYDIDVARDIIPSKNGYLYDNINEENREDMRLVLSKTFLDEKYKIRVASTTTVIQSDYSYYCEENYNRPSSSVYEKDGKAYLWNPHLRHYGCYGDRKSDIYEAIKKYDYYSIAMYANASNNNVGFGDNVVMPKFVSDIIKNRKTKIFYCPADGQDYSFDDIIAREKGEEAI